MPKPQSIQLGRAVEIPILYEDRSVLAIDKPAGWMLLPAHWEGTAENLQLAITSSIRAGDFWARSRNLKFLRFVHRLDADTTGILLFAKSPGAVAGFSRLFESRQIHKTYYVVVDGEPAHTEWRCSLPLGPDPRQPSRMIVDRRSGKEAETIFRVLHRASGKTLVAANPLTGRTHQIRVHLAAKGCPVLGDVLYGPPKQKRIRGFPLALRAVELEYNDPFTRKLVRISASVERFLRAYGWDPDLLSRNRDDKLPPVRAKESTDK
jgi:RluA family pseudouridine synthase